MTAKQVWIGLGAGLLVVLLVAAIGVTWVVNQYLTVSGLEAQLSTALQREVRLSNVEFSLWSGVKLSGVEVSEFPRGSSGKMLSAESIALQPRWWPLIRGEVVIGSVVVQKPTLRLVRNKDGSWNATRGFPAVQAPGVKPGSTAGMSVFVFSPPPARAQSSSGEESTSPVQLTVNQVDLLEGNIQFTDRLKNRNFDFSFRRIGVSDFDPSRGGTLEIDGLGFGNTTVNGTVELNRQPLQVRMTEGHLKQLNLESIRPYLSPHLPAGTSLRRGLVDSTVETAAYGDDRIQFQGQLAVKDFSGSFGAYNPVPLSQISLTGQLQHQLSTGKTQLDLDGMNLDGTEYAGDINLELNPPWSNPALQGTINLQDLDVERTLTTARAFAPAAIPAVGPVTGTVEKTNLRLSNRVQNLKITGSIEISGVDVSHDQLPASLHVKRAVFELVDSRLKVDASLDQFNGSMDVKGTIDRYRTPEQASLDVDVVGNSLDVASLLKAVRGLKQIPLPAMDGTGTIKRLEASLSGRLFKPEYRVKSTVGDLKLTTKPLPRPLNLKRAQVEIDPTTARILSAQIQEFGGTADVQGTVQNYTTPDRAQLDLSFKGSNLDVADALETVQSTKWVELPELKASGKVTSVEGTLKGGLTRPTYTVRGTLESLSVDATMLPRNIRASKASFDLNPQSVRVNADLSDFGGVVSVQGTVENYTALERARFDVSGSGKSLSIGPMAAFLGSTKWIELPEMEIDGTLETVQGQFSGTLQSPRYSATGRVKSVSLSSKQFPGKVEGINGGFGYDGEYLSLDALEGRYQQRPFKLAGKLPLPFSEGKNFELTADLDKFPVQAIASFVPLEELPGGIKVENGFITLRNFSVRGNLGSPRASGEVRVEEGALQMTQLKQPVEAIDARIELRNNRGTVESLSARAAGGQINGKGNFNLNDQTLDLRINTDPFAVRELSEQITALPPFPDNWKPGGKVSVKANVENKFIDPVVKGTVSAPSLSIGKISGSDASSPFVFRDGQLTLSDLKMNSFGGKLSGQSTLKLLDQTPSFNADVNVSSLQLASILNSLASVGKESRGNFNGVLSFSGPLSNPYELDGRVQLGGRDLVLKGTKFSEGLSGAFDIQNRDASDVGKIVGLLLKRTDLGQSLGLNEMFSPEVTSQFKRADLNVNFLKGQGTIQTLELENDDLTISGSGNIHLRGDLNAQLRIHPKKKLLVKAKKDWLRNALAQGLPPLAVSGTYYQPQFAFQQFTQQLASRLVEQQLSPESKPKKKKQESKKDQQKKAVEKLLRDIFD